MMHGRGWRALLWNSGLMGVIMITALPYAASAQSPATRPVGATVNDSIDSPAVRDSAYKLDAAAASLAQRGKYAPALALWQQATKVAPNDRAAHFNSGMMFEITRHPQEGLHEFQIAYALYPDPQILYHLGVSFHNMGARDSALTWFLAATTAQPRDVESWGYAGFTAAELGRDSLALVYWRRALALQPRYFDFAEPEQRPVYQRVLRSAAAARPADSTR